MASELTTPTPSPRYGQTLATVVAVLLAFGLLFLPIILLNSDISASSPPADPDSLEVGVGIVVVIRATARRLLRAGAQAVMRTVFGAFTRTTARTVTRRMARIFVRQLAALTFASFVREAWEEKDLRISLAASLRAIALGFVALFASFYVILVLIGTEQAQYITGGVPALEASLLMALPLILHAAITYGFASVCQVGVQYRTQLDGLLLQGYFTGAASFLPLTTDVEYHGSPRAKARLALGTLAGLMLVHLGLFAAARATASPHLLLAASGVLMYAFVFSFPLSPLEGHYLWQRSKLLWVAVWLPILLTFVSNLPAAITEVL